MSDLSSTIALVEREFAAARKACADHDHSSEGHRARRQVMEGLATQLATDLGARINNRWDGASVKLAGIRSSSTMGIEGALRNWLTAARKREGVS